MLDGATFELYRVSGEMSGSNGTLIATGTTDMSGVVVFAGLEAGYYIVNTIYPEQLKKKYERMVGMTNIEPIVVTYTYEVALS